jgi:uncharacterized protein DUF4244
VNRPRSTTRTCGRDFRRHRTVRCHPTGVTRTCAERCLLGARAPRAGLLARALDAAIVAPDLLRSRLRGQDPEAGMTTAEYAVGTIAACALAAVLYRVVTSATVAAALTGVVHRALDLAN